MFGVLSGGDENFALMNSRWGNELVPIPPTAALVKTALGVAIKLPEEIAARWLERPEPTVSAWHNHLRLANDFQPCWA